MYEMLACSVQESKLSYLNDVTSVWSIPTLHGLPHPSMVFFFFWLILFLGVWVETRVMQTGSHDAELTL